MDWLGLGSLILLGLLVILDTIEAAPLIDDDDDIGP